MKRILLLLTISSFLCVLGIIGCGGDSTTTTPESERPGYYGWVFSREFTEVCSGQSVSSAAAYPTANPSPLVMLAYEVNEVTGNYGSSLYNGNDVPEAWRGNAIEDIELVACVYERFVKIKNCGFYRAEEGGLLSSPDTRRHKVEITLREAKTGNTVAETTLWGSDPGPCPATVTVTNMGPIASVGDFDGSEVPLSEVLSWLTPYVER